jgi:hypothetical protein
MEGNGGIKLASPVPSRQVASEVARFGTRFRSLDYNPVTSNTTATFRLRYTVGQVMLYGRNDRSDLPLLGATPSLVAEATLD